MSRRGISFASDEQNTQSSLQHSPSSGVFGGEQEQEKQQLPNSNNNKKHGQVPLKLFLQGFLVASITLIVTCVCIVLVSFVNSSSASVGAQLALEQSSNVAEAISSQLRSLKQAAQGISGCLEARCAGREYGRRRRMLPTDDPLQNFRDVYESLFARQNLTVAGDPLFHRPAPGGANSGADSRLRALILKEAVGVFRSSLDGSWEGMLSQTRRIYGSKFSRLLVCLPLGATQRSPPSPPNSSATNRSSGAQSTGTAMNQTTAPTGSTDSLVTTLRLLGAAVAHGMDHCGRYYFGVPKGNKEATTQGGPLLLSEIPVVRTGTPHAGGEEDLSLRWFFAEPLFRSDTDNSSSAKTNIASCVLNNGTTEDFAASVAAAFEEQCHHSLTSTEPFILHKSGNDVERTEEGEGRWLYSSNLSRSGFLAAVNLTSTPSASRGDTSLDNYQYALYAREVPSLANGSAAGIDIGADCGGSGTAVVFVSAQVEPPSVKELPAVIGQQNTFASVARHYGRPVLRFPSSPYSDDKANDTAASIAADDGEEALIRAWTPVNIDPSYWQSATSRSPTSTSSTSAPPPPGGPPPSPNSPADPVSAVYGIQMPWSANTSAYSDVGLYVFTTLSADTLHAEAKEGTQIMILVSIGIAVGITVAGSLFLHMLVQPMLQLRDCMIRVGNLDSATLHSLTTRGGADDSDAMNRSSVVHSSIISELQGISEQLSLVAEQVQTVAFLLETEDVERLSADQQALDAGATPMGRGTDGEGASTQTDNVSIFSSRSWKTRRRKSSAMYSAATFTSPRSSGFEDTLRIQETFAGLQSVRIHVTYESRFTAEEIATSDFDLVYSETEIGDLYQRLMTQCKQCCGENPFEEVTLTYLSENDEPILVRNSIQLEELFSGAPTQVKFLMHRSRTPQYKMALSPTADLLNVAVTLAFVWKQLAIGEFQTPTIAFTCFYFFALAMNLVITLGLLRGSSSYFQEWMSQASMEVGMTVCVATLNVQNMKLMWSLIRVGSRRSPLLTFNGPAETKLVQRSISWSLFGFLFSDVFQLMFKIWLLYNSSTVQLVNFLALATSSMSVAFNLVFRLHATFLWQSSSTSGSGEESGKESNQNGSGDGGIGLSAVAGGGFSLGDQRNLFDASEGQLVNKEVTLVLCRFVVPPYVQLLNLQGHEYNNFYTTAFTMARAARATVLYAHGGEVLLAFNVSRRTAGDLHVVDAVTFAANLTKATAAVGCRVCCVAVTGVFPLGMMGSVASKTLHCLGPLASLRRLIGMGLYMGNSSVGRSSPVPIIVSSSVVQALRRMAAAEQVAQRQPQQGAQQLPSSAPATMHRGVAVRRTAPAVAPSSNGGGADATADGEGRDRTGVMLPVALQRYAVAQIQQCFGDSPGGVGVDEPGDPSTEALLEKFGLTVDAGAYVLVPKDDYSPLHAVADYRIAQLATAVGLQQPNRERLERKLHRLASLYSEWHRSEGEEWSLQGDHPPLPAAQTTGSPSSASTGRGGSTAGRLMTHNFVLGALRAKKERSKFTEKDL